MIYLDYQATTPVAPEVAEAMQPWIEEKFANPHSPSRWGREAEAAIEVARKQVERGDRSRRRQSSPSPEARPKRSTGRSRAPSRSARQAGAQPDHHGRDRACRSARHLRVAGSAGHRPHHSCRSGATAGSTSTLLERELDDRVAAGRGDAGQQRDRRHCSRSPQIAEMAHGVGALMLCDAVQGAWAGRYPRWARPGRRLGAQDPRSEGHRRACGCGRACEPAPLIHGGGQERGMRSGTLSPALCVGFGAAAKLAAERCDRDYDHVQRLWAAAHPRARTGLDHQRQHRAPLLRQSQHSPRRHRRGAAARRSARHRVLARQRPAPAVPDGQATCSGRSGSITAQARSSIRLGFGRYTTQEELVEACSRIAAAAEAQEHLVA